MTQKDFVENKAIIIAQYFIKKNEKDHKGLDNKKIQKLLYYSQAWNLVFNKKPFFSDKIEAWIHGPAILEVWKNFKDFDFTIPHPEISEDSFNFLKKEEKELLDDVWRVYGKFDGDYLEVLSHNESPWQKARQGLRDVESSQNEITLDSIKEFYLKKWEEAAKKKA